MTARGAQLTQGTNDSAEGITMQLQKRCLKIDKTNAQAMIVGYPKGGVRIHQSIWCAVITGDFPALITLNRRPAKFQMSELGKSLDPESFSIPYGFVAKLDCQYFIRNDIHLWERACRNGLFDVWDPIAPKTRFDNAHAPSSNFRIQLLRLYEIYETFDESDVAHVSDRIDHLVANNRNVTIKAPVISDLEFSDIKKKLENSVADFHIPEPRGMHRDRWRAY